MAIGVLIKRVTKPGSDAKELMPLIVELRSLAVRQPGYISGETFFNLDRPEECVVIGRWTSLEYWQQFNKNKRRSELIDSIEKQLESKAEYNIYDIGLWQTSNIKECSLYVYISVVIHHVITEFFKCQKLDYLQQKQGYQAPEKLTMCDYNHNLEG